MYNPFNFFLVLITGPSTENMQANAKMTEVEADDAALSKQVADCLQNTNKQKLAYALKALKRLDIAGTGYITVREFRDVLLMYQVFIIGGALEKLIEKYKSNGGKINYTRLWNFVSSEYTFVQYMFLYKNKQTSKQTSKQTNKQTSKQTNKETNKQTNKQANKQKANKQANKQTNKQTSKQTNKQTNKQTS